MAGSKSTGGLPPAAPLTGADLIHVEQGGNSRKAPISALAAAVPPGPPGLANNGFATRAVMAAFAPAGGVHVGDNFFLAEHGREGTFIVDLAATWTAQIAADTAQQRFVVSSADATKVYRRVSFGGALPWAGATGDFDIGAQAGTDDAPAIMAGLADLQSESIHFPGLGYARGGGRYVIPKPKNSYRLGSTIDLNCTIRMDGGGSGQPGGLSTIFSVAADIPAFRYQAGNTVGDTGTYVPGSLIAGANGSVVGGFAVVGPGANGTTVLENPVARGHYMRTSISLRDVNVWNMQGPAVEILAGVGAPELGSANCWEITSAWFQDCTYGIKTSLSDTNAGIATHVKVSGARAWGIQDASGAANLYLAPLTQLCGVWGDGTANKPTSRVHQGGVHYAVRKGQEAWASVNPPPAGHNDNLGWIWYEDGAGGGGPNPVDWFNGINLRAGGPFNIVNGGTMVGAYWEGFQPPSQCGGGALFMGGTWGGNRMPIGAAWINAGSGNVTVNSLDVVSGGIGIRDDGGVGFGIGRYSPGNPALIVATGLATTIGLGVPGAQPFLASASEVDIHPYSGHGWYFASANGNFAPFPDNTSDIGNAGHRIANLWCGNATIQTSDRNLKTEIRALSSDPFIQLLDAVGAVPLVAFKFKDAVAVKGDKARDHYGIVAQDLHDELVKRGLDPFAGGVLGYDPVFEDLEEEVEIEQEAMSTVMVEKATIEIVDGKAIRTVELVEQQVPDFDYVQLHDEHGTPIINPARPPETKLVKDPQTGEEHELELAGVPEQPILHPVRRMELVTVKQKVSKPKLDENGEQEFIWNVRYSEFFTLRQAWLERELLAVSTKAA